MYLESLINTFLSCTFIYKVYISKKIRQILHSLLALALLKNFFYMHIIAMWPKPLISGMSQFLNFLIIALCLIEIETSYRCKKTLWKTKLKCDFIRALALLCYGHLFKIFICTNQFDLLTLK